MIINDLEELRKIQKKAERERFEVLLLQHIYYAGLPEPVRQHRFHETRKWLFDLAWPAIFLAVEVEGGAFSGGRHVRGKGFEEDCLKYNEAVLLGWRLLRFTTGQVEQGTALQVIRRFFKEVKQE